MYSDAAGRCNFKFGYDSQGIVKLLLERDDVEGDWMNEDVVMIHDQSSHHWHGAR
jgi:hypothetical protein